MSIDNLTSVGTLDDVVETKSNVILGLDLDSDEPDHFIRWEDADLLGMNQYDSYRKIFRSDRGRSITG
jgi:hypothetical protein